MRVPTSIIDGIVSGRRELLTKAEKTPWAWSVTIQAVGGTYELTTRDKTVWEKVGVGVPVTATAGHEFYNGTVRFSLISFIEQKNGFPPAGK